MNDREYSGCEIAIIGMSGRFPGAKDIRAYWQNLKDGIPAMRYLADEELLSKGVDPRLLRKAGYVKAVSMLDGVELFDASFFGFTPREAALMDPQHRIFLECAWEALESAGYTAGKTDELISVFASSTTNTYLLYNLLSNQDLLTQLDPVQIDVSNGNDYLATRVSYKLNLTGPSCTVQSACSSSLVAVHMACQNLLNQESDIAIAGGISIDVRQQLGYQYSDGSIVSPDGYCRAFDAEANGTVFGSGVGIIVLRRLEDALAKGDTIYAIIKGSAMNNDGADKVGYTAPAVDGQADVVAQALSVAGCGPETISYIETHGTGTKMGDPVEMRALSKVFQAKTAKKNFCAIGSVKTQIGHLAGAAGISSLIKTVLTLHNRQIPASLNFKKPNPEIDFTNSPFFVNTELKEWNHELRRAGVSSFGVGGTNVHMILEEAPVVEATAPVRNHHLLLLSAKTEGALTRAKEALAESLAGQNQGLNLADVAFTLQVGRKDFNYRSFAVCSDVNDVNDVVAIFRSDDKSKIVSSINEVEDRPVVFVFPGQDSSDNSPSCGLYEHEPLFKQEYDKCLDTLTAVLNKAGRRGDRITHTSLRQSIHSSGQPKLFKQIDHFITEYAMATILLGLGILPEAMIGEDTGEYTAACIAGVLSVEHVLLLYLAQDGFSIENAPAHAHAGVSQIGNDGFKDAIRRLQRKAPKIPFISALTGQWITDSEAQSADYWLEDRKKESRFTRGLGRIMEDETEKILLQIGRRTAALDPGTGAPKNGLVHRTHSDYRGDGADAASFFQALGELWLNGVKIDWQGLYRNETRQRVPLPTYPFNSERYWIERAQRPEKEQSPQITGKDVNPDNWFYFPGWKSSSPPDHDVLFAAGDNWLIFGDPSPFSAEVGRFLKDKGQRVIFVHVGTDYQAQQGENCYTIHPGRKGDYETLFATLKTAGRVPKKILHLWSLGANVNSDGKGATTASDKVAFQEYQEKGFWSLIYTAMALEKPDVSGFRYQIWTITDQLFQVESSDIIVPEKATLLAPAQVIPTEYPYIDCFCLDIKPVNRVEPPAVAQAVSRTTSQTVTQIFKEIQTPGPDKIIAYRGRQRWLQNYEPLQLSNQPVKPLRPEGVYLVTDDTNGIGLLIAEHLVKTCQAKVLLIENTSFPERGSWSLRANKEEGFGGKIRKIMGLEATGRLQCSCMDLSDFDQVAQAVKQVCEDYGALHGVIHGADDLNSTGFNPLPELGNVNRSDYFGLKIKGTNNLQKALAPYELDFLMLISSLAPVLGGLGQTLNAAQCAFLDHFAIQAGAPWISVNWDIWQLTEQGRQLQEGIYKDAIEPEEGIRAFLKIITAYTGNRLIVSTSSLPQRILRLRHGDGNMRETSPHSAQFRRPRPELKTPYACPVSEVEKKLAASWEDCLGIENIGIDDNFFDLGGDSLISINLMNQVSSIIDKKIPAAILYQKATIRELAAVFGEEDASTQAEKSEQLNQRKEALSRRNELLHSRRRLKSTEGEDNDE